MAVFRIDKTRDYTVMANHHLRNKALSLKAKGLLSLMLSLPEDWDYTTKGLSMICKDGVDSIAITGFRYQRFTAFYTVQAIQIRVSPPRRSKLYIACSDFFQKSERAHAAAADDCDCAGSPPTVLP